MEFHCFSKRRAAVLRRQARRHKNIIHGSLLVIIAVCLYADGAKAADLGFLVLSVVVEVS